MTFNDKFETRSSLVLNGKFGPKFSIACCSGGGGSSEGTTTPQMTPQKMLATYSQALPGILGIQSDAVAPTTSAMAGGAAAANPVYTASGLSQLGSYAPGYATAGNALAQQQATAQEQLFSGKGSQIARDAYALNNELNPVQAASNRQSTNLLNTYNLGGLSPGEYAAIERSLNNANQSTGNLGNLNATNTITNAMNFGGAFNSKLAGLGNALGAANQTAANQSAQFNAVNTALGAGNTATNFGLTQYNPTQANNTLTTPFSAAASLGNQIAGVASAPVGTTSSSNASGGCFLTTACCEWRGLPDDCDELTTLRNFRDSYVPKSKVDEYYRIAPTIVEKVRGNKEALEFIYQTVKRCVTLVKAGEPVNAMSVYEGMVNKLV